MTRLNIRQALVMIVSTICHLHRSLTFSGHASFLVCSFCKMNVTPASVNVVIQYRDSFAKAVTKNVIVLILGISINYINVGLIHTFCKHQVKNSFHILALIKISIKKSSSFTEKCRSTVFRVHDHEH